MPKEKATGEDKIQYYPYLQSISPRVGLLVNSDDLKRSETVYSILYLLPKIESPQIEVGAEVIPNFEGFLHVSKRHIFKQRDYFRPFVKYGLNLSVVSKENLATFFNFKNYGLRVGMGLEDLLRPPMSLRIDIEALISAQSTALIVTFGYSWGW